MTEAGEGTASIGVTTEGIAINTTSVMKELAAIAISAMSQTRYRASAVRCRLTAAAATTAISVPIHRKCPNDSTNAADRSRRNRLFMTMSHFGVRPLDAALGF